MLADELFSLCPEAPLAPSRAAELVRSFPGLGPAPTPARAFSCAGGAAAGAVFGADVRADAPCVCAIGAFDGFHLGHQGLLARAGAEATSCGASCVAVTFSPDPAAVVGAGEKGSRLLDVAGRVRLLLAGGADSVVVFDFTPGFAALTYEQFIDALCELLRLERVVVGSNFRLGSRGAGDVRALSELGAHRGFSVVGVDLLDEGGEHVSATRIRGLVRAGRVEAASGLMGRPLAMAGGVAHGRGEGTSFGFPTANIVGDAACCIPEQGVYAGLVTPLTGASRESFPAAINVGLPPTFAGGRATGGAFMEANLIGFSGDLYGADVAVTFLRWLRDSRPFSCVEELERTVLGNIDWVARTFGDQGISL